MSYDIDNFRAVRHGLDDESFHCRQCESSDAGVGSAKKGRVHAKKTQHTVDVYREHWTEYTCYKKQQ